MSAGWCRVPGKPVALDVMGGRFHMHWLAMAAIVVTSALAVGLWRMAIPSTDTPADLRIPLGVLGDSDSHSYHDAILLDSAHPRGGRYHAVTYQWTEILGALRGSQVDLGRWSVWGSWGQVAALLRRAGIHLRAPRKQDYRFNFAITGARCEDLLNAPYRQTAQLLDVMREDSSRWARGVVVIRIGINSIGRQQDLDHYAATGLDAASRARIGRCHADIHRAMTMIRAEHPHTAIVIAGMSDDRNVPSNFSRWRSATAMTNITDVLQWDEQSLRNLCASDPRAVFISDREWFDTIWGSRNAVGEPAYRDIGFGGVTTVQNTMGDHPGNVTLADGHAGSVSNGLWARHFVDVLRMRFGLSIRPITPAEIASLVDPDGAFGISVVTTQGH